MYGRILQRQVVCHCPLLFYPNLHFMCISKLYRIATGLSQISKLQAGKILGCILNLSGLGFIFKSQFENHGEKGVGALGRKTVRYVRPRSIPHIYLKLHFTSFIKI
jgi:hypothetical protein